jgi:hypothetical protein
MKFIKKNIIFKSSFFLKISIFTVIFFILGMWTEKYDLLKKPNYFFTKIYENLYSKVVTEVYDIEKLIIDIDYKNFEKIKRSREIALKNQRLRQNDAKWSSAKLIYNNKKNKIKIRLKGMLNDHWSHPYKWSFYVKIDDNNSSIFNLRRFTLQPPETLNFVKEWLYMKALKKEGLIYHRTKFLELIINGNQYGLYTLQERSMKELIENNRRREGPVVIFSNQERLEEEINLNYLSANKISDYFWRSQIKPVQFKESYKGTVQEKYLNKAISLLELFRDKKLSVDEVFDLDQISKIMAIRAIFGSTEFDVDDLKFYYNPVSNLLEPISKEVHSEPKRFLSGFNPWIFNSDNLRYPGQKHFLDLFFNDDDFYKKYLSELNNYSTNEYILNLIKQNEAEFKEVKKILKLNFPSEELFINKDFENISTFIQNTLNPIQKPHFNLLKIFNNNLEFKVTNTQILPIEITGLAKDNDILDLKSSIFVGGVNVNSNFFNKNDFQKIIRIECLTIKCDQDSLDKIDVKYKVFGQEKIYSNSINFWNNNLKLETFNSKLSDPLFILDKYKFIKKIGKNIVIEDQDWKIDEKIIIPEDHKLIVKKGKIRFSNKGQLISFSPIFIEGEKENPVIITSDLNQNLNKENGNGILIINTNEESVLNNVIFKNLSAPNVISGIGLLGSINFYKADVKILNTKFYNNLVGDDYINIIKSNFHIENSYFEETNSDSIDIDFSKGSIINSKFFMSKNDAIDFSGSEVNLENINIYGAGDKAISVGEGSILRAKNILIENSNIGVASKDSSIAYLDNVAINNVNIGLAAYIKKIEYGAPEIIVTDIKLSNYQNDFISDLNSKITVDDKLITNTNCKKNIEVCSFLIN